MGVHVAGTRRCDEVGRVVADEGPRVQVEDMHPGVHRDRDAARRDAGGNGNQALAGGCADLDVAVDISGYTGVDIGGGVLVIDADVGADAYADAAAGQRAGDRNDRGVIVGADRQVAAARHGNNGAATDVRRGGFIQHIHCRGTRDAGRAAYRDARRNRQDVFARCRGDGHRASRRDLRTAADVGLHGVGMHERRIGDADPRGAGRADRAGDHGRLEGIGGQQRDGAAGVQHCRIPDIGVGFGMQVRDRDRRGDADVAGDAHGGGDRQHGLGRVGRHADGAARADRRVVVDVGVRVLVQDLDVQTDSDPCRAGRHAERARNRGDRRLIDRVDRDRLAAAGRIQPAPVDLAAGADVGVGIQVEVVDDERAADGYVALACGA